MEIELVNYRNEMHQELQNILSWWTRFAVDHQYGGFIGKVDNENHADYSSPKGSVLNSRILWSFSAAYNFTKQVQYLQMAERAYKYLSKYLIDKTFGGVYWTVDHNGHPLDTKKQIYALSFAVYGLSEYFKSSADEVAKQQAVELYETIVKYSYDKTNGGYSEAFSREWKEIEDIRLSVKDANEKKSMNTHLHILEAFANLYRVWPNEKLRVRIQELIKLFLDHIIDKKSQHLFLFFDETWHPRGNIYSYGHDIEAAWLIQEAAEIIEDAALIEELKPQSVKLVNAAIEGLDNDGGLWYEYDVEDRLLVHEKHWWPQAEAMVGFFNAWEITGQKNFLEKSLAAWAFVKKHMLNQTHGEWYWGISADDGVMLGQEKAGIWKCPYHNSRACIEILKRIK